MKETKKINSKLKIELNDKNCYEIVVEGETDVDKFLLKVNEKGSGSLNVNPAPVFGYLKSINKLLSLTKFKKK